MSPRLTNAVPDLLPLKALFLAPLFNGICSQVNGKTALVVVNSILLVFIRAVFTLPILGM